MVTMLSFAKIGLIGLVMLSSKMAIAEENVPWRNDWRCGENFNNSLANPAECNPNPPNAYCCNAWGWCGDGKENCGCSTCKNYRKDYDDDANKQLNNDKHDTNGADVVTSTTTTTTTAITTTTTTTATNTTILRSGCCDKIYINFARGSNNHQAPHDLYYLYGWNIFFVKDKEVDEENVYKSIPANFKKPENSNKAKAKTYAMWWKKGYWMVGEADKRGTYTALAYARSNKNCPEEINYDWMYFSSLD